MDPSTSGRPEQAPGSLEEQLEELREELRQVRADRDALAVVEKEILMLLKSGSRREMLHDLRNVLNQLGMLKALMERTNPTRPKTKS